MQSSMLRIRASSPQDVPAIAAMMVEFETFLLALIKKRKKLSVRNFERAIRAAVTHEPPLAHGLIAEDRGKPLGYILYSPAFNPSTRKPTVYVQDLFVRDVARRKGVGKALMLEIKKIARKMRCGEVIWTVWNRNPKALGFYLSLGAKPVDDEIIMEWDLSKRK